MVDANLHLNALEINPTYFLVGGWFMLAYCSRPGNDLLIAVETAPHQDRQMAPTQSVCSLWWSREVLSACGFPRLTTWRLVELSTSVIRHLEFKL
jgi:hypothetical protein